MKHIVRLMLCLVLMTAVFCLVACGHTEHTVEETWQSDAEGHWHTCSKCTDKVDFAAHTPGTPVDENVIASTCFNEGSKEVVIYCTVCNYEISRVQQTIDKTEHTPGNDWNSDATDHWKECSVAECDEKLNKAAHIPAAAVDENVVPATCSTEGSKDVVIYCSVCHYEISRNHVTLPVTDDIPAETWSHDENSHWHECTGDCGRKLDMAAHTAQGELKTDGTDEWYECICGVKVDVTAHTHRYNIFGDNGTVTCICGDEMTVPDTQRVDLDVQYVNTVVDLNYDKTVVLDLSRYDSITYVSASFADSDIEAVFENGMLTIHVSEFGFAYGMQTLSVNVKDATGTDRTIQVPLLLVTKVLMDKADFDSMSAISKETEAENDYLYGGYFELGANIVYNARYLGIMPSNNVVLDHNGGFVGTFDGCGYCVSGIQINGVYSDATLSLADNWDNFNAVFGILKGGTIKNTSFTEAKVHTKGSLIVATGWGTIENLYISFAELKYNNPIGAFFSKTANATGSIVKDCIIDISACSFSGRYGSDGPENCIYLLGSTQAETLSGVYVIGTSKLPANYGTITPGFTEKEGSAWGTYEDMTAFMAAYNANGSALKAEIDTWNTQYWIVESDRIVFCVDCDNNHISDNILHYDSTSHWHLCKFCGEKIDIYAHNPGSEQIENEDPATCIHEGSRDKVVYCTDCGCEISRINESIPKPSHTPSNTWSSDGTNHWHNCTTPGCTQQLDITAHTPADAADENVQEPDCINAGSKDVVVYCSDCGYEISRTPTVLPSRGGHSPKAEYEYDTATHWHECSGCDEKIPETEAAHVAGSALFSDGEYDWNECVCGYHMNVVPHTNHIYNIWSDGNMSCVCGQVAPDLTDTRFVLDLASDNKTGTVIVDLSAYASAGITSVTAKLGDTSVNTSLENNILTLTVPTTIYGNKALILTLNNAKNETATLSADVLIVTKVLMNKADFDSMSAISKEAEAGNAYLYGGYFELGANIVYNARYSGIMPSNDDIVKNNGGFVGTFDGCGYCVSGIQINGAYSGMADNWNNYNAVFGILKGGTIKNTSFTEAKVHTKGSLIVASGWGTIENLYISFAELKYNNPISAFFSKTANATGSIVKDCIIDISTCSFSGRYGSDGPENCIYLLGSTQAETLSGVYVIGTSKLPANYGTITPGFTEKEGSAWGTYEDMTAFMAAYNADGSALKAEIDTWNTQYWTVESKSVSFKTKD